MRILHFLQQLADEYPLTLPSVSQLDGLSLLGREGSQHQIVFIDYNPRGVYGIHTLISGDWLQQV
jgi:hypothetical protein